MLDMLESQAPTPTAVAGAQQQQQQQQQQHTSHPPPKRVNSAEANGYGTRVVKQDPPVRGRRPSAELAEANSSGGVPPASKTKAFEMAFSFDRSLSEAQPVWPRDHHSFESVGGGYAVRGTTPQRGLSHATGATTSLPAGGSGEGDATRERGGWAGAGASAVGVDGEVLNIYADLLQSRAVDLASGGIAGATTAAESYMDVVGAVATTTFSAHVDASSSVQLAYIDVTGADDGAVASDGSDEEDANDRPPVQRRASFTIMHNSPDVTAPAPAPAPASLSSSLVLPAGTVRRGSYQEPGSSVSMAIEGDFATYAI
jgi:hypothetical protein